MSRAALATLIALLKNITSIREDFFLAEKSGYIQDRSVARKVTPRTSAILNIVETMPFYPVGTTSLSGNVDVEDEAPFFFDLAVDIS